MQQRIEKLERQIQDIINRLSDIETVRDPQRANIRIDLLAQQYAELQANLAKLSQKQEAFVRDEKFIEIFTDEEFKNLYNQSGLCAKDVAKLIQTHKDFKDVDVSQPAISKIVNGVIGNLFLRSFLGREFIYEIAKRRANESRI